MSNRVEKVQALIDTFEHAEGRRPRILVAKIGQDGGSVPPASMFLFRLTQDAIARLRWLDFKKIALHRGHPVIESFGQMVELHQLLRQIASGVGEMQHAAMGVALLERAGVPHGGIADNGGTSRRLDQHLARIGRTEILWYARLILR